VAKLKAEFLHQYYKSHRRPVRMRLIAAYSLIQRLAHPLSGIYNFLVTNNNTDRFIKRLLGFALERSLPKINKETWHSWLKKNLSTINQLNSNTNSKVYLFIDEFTNFNEAHIGIKATQLLSKLGYKIEYIKHRDSGRAYLSKGFLIKARKIAASNVRKFKDVINADTPLIGIEPSAVLSFRDEYPDLLQSELKQAADKISDSVFTIEEFILHEFEKGNIDRSKFTTAEKRIKYHGHCQQKAIVGTDPARSVLSLPENFIVEEIKSGCCGMAGSFGYEKEHYDLSMQVGELVLFPAIRNSKESEFIAASGTSCRHHIKDGTGKLAVHPVEILWDAMNQ
jgi:Fe-S oxidoreductase